MWYNSKTNELQSMPPWGSGWIHPDIQAEQYGDWQQVDDGFVPPQPAQEPVTPAVDQGTADMWEAILALSTQMEALKGGN